MKIHRTMVVLALAGCLGAAYGCDRKATKTAPRPAPAAHDPAPGRAAGTSTAKTVGKWQALMGEEAPGKFYARMTMEQFIA